MHSIISEPGGRTAQGLPRELDTLELRWRATLIEVADFYRATGRCPRSKDTEHKKLAAWVGTQRKAVLTPSRRAALDRQIPGWERKVHTDWDEQLRQLSSYHQRTGRLPRMYGAGDEEERRLGAWLSSQRTAKQGNSNKLWTPSREKKMDAVLPEWEDSTRPREDAWEAKARSFAVWRRSHDGRWPRQTAQEDDERHWSNWLSDQRRDSQGRGNSWSLSRGRVLSTIAPGWESVKETSWYAKLDLLVKWRNKNRQKWPSRDSDDPEEKSLAGWLKHQRKLKSTGALSHSVERDRALQDSAPGWDGILRSRARDARLEAQWEHNLGELEAWSRTRPLPKQGQQDPEEKRLAQWMFDQRKRLRGQGKARLPEKRILMLDSRVPGWRGEKPIP